MDINAKPLSGLGLQKIRVVLIVVNDVNFYYSKVIRLSASGG
jgi:hypothetical protein